MTLDFGVMLFLAVLVLIFFVGFMETCKELRRLKAEAVKRGVAFWKADPDTGETEFRWKDH